MTLEFANPQNSTYNFDIGNVISRCLTELSNNIDIGSIVSSSLDNNNLAEKNKKLQVIRVNSDLNQTKYPVSNPIANNYHAMLCLHKNIIKENDERLKDLKINIEDILSEFGDISKIYYKNLEKGNYDNTITGHYLVNESVFAPNGVEKQLEFTFNQGELLIYSYIELLKDKNDNIIYYKFVNFSDNGKTVINSLEYYVIGNQRLEILRDSQGCITEIKEETGKEVTAFQTIMPTYIVKKNKFGNIVEYREYEYDEFERIINTKLIKNNSCLILENIYKNDFIISNYKNYLGNTYWTRIFNNKIKRHVSEQLFDAKGELIREEKFLYNQYGDLTFRIDKNADGEIISSKEIKYNKHNSPVLIINRGEDGSVKSKIQVA